MKCFQAGLFLSISVFLHGTSSNAAALNDEWASLPEGVLTNHSLTRLVGTNLIDYSPLMSELRSKQWNVAKFPAVTNLVRFQVFQYSFPSRTNSLVIRNPRIVFRRTENVRSLYGSNSDVLRSLASSSLGDAISLGQFLTLDPSMKSAYRPETVGEYVVIENLPQTMPPQHEYVAFAWPKGNLVMTRKDGTRVTFQTFDYGIPFTNSIDGMLVRQVTSSGFRDVQLPTRKAKLEAEAEKARAADQRLLKFQMEQAEKGFSQFQYEIAVRYLDGKGVEKNRSKGIDLLQRASKDGHAKAASLLQKLETE